MKTPAPITGGMNWPPVEAMALMAPASWGRKPVRFMSGIVKEPVVTTLATDEPEIEPNKAEVITAILAGPPRQRPATAVPRFMKKPPAPDRSRKAPKIMKGKTKVAQVSTEERRVGKEGVRTWKTRCEA